MKALKKGVTKRKPEEFVDQSPVQLFQNNHHFNVTSSNINVAGKDQINNNFYSLGKYLGITGNKVCKLNYT